MTGMTGSAQTMGQCVGVKNPQKKSRLVKIVSALGDGKTSITTCTQH